MEQYLCKDHEGKFFIVEAPSPEDARDAAVLDGGEVIMALQSEDEPDELAEGIEKLIGTTMDDLFKLPEFKFASRKVGLKK